MPVPPCWRGSNEEESVWTTTWVSNSYFLLVLTTRVVVFGTDARGRDTSRRAVCISYGNKPISIQDQEYKYLADVLYILWCLARTFHIATY